jgi:anti-sigma regulatory factor (Ser/Thr protein kinase)
MYAMSKQTTRRYARRKKIYPASFESLDNLRGFVARAAGDCGLNEQAVYAVKLAVDEAFTNIIEHAYGGESEEKIECTCLIEDPGLTVVIKDCGKPFHPEQVPSPNLTASLEERDEGGLGLYFMRQLMDRVDFTFADQQPGGRRCNVLTMFKGKEKKQ